MTTAESTALASIVIPAHLEAQAVPRQLDSILGQELGDLRLHVVLVANGSTDGTAEAARAWIPAFAERGHRLDVAELPVASKAAALNEGDALARGFPRIYLDADILLSPNAVRRTVEVLESSEEPLLAAPSIRIEGETCPAARAYGRVWSGLPYIRNQVPGVGFYAVNEAGRRRWWCFPSRLGADDKFVRLHFATRETRVVGDAWFSISMPRRLRELLRIRGRWNDLNWELARSCPRLQARDVPRILPSAVHCLGRPRTWPDLPGFLVVWSGGLGFGLLRRLGIGERWARAGSTSIRTDRAGPRPPAVRGTRGPRVAAVPRPRGRGLHAIVVTHRSVRTIGRCLDSLLERREPDELRITVVDNASDDGTREVVRGRLGGIPGTELIANAGNRGYAAAVNQGTRGSEARFLAIVNPDVEVRPRTLAACTEHLARHPTHGLCGVPAVRRDGAANDRSFLQRPSLWSEWTLMLGLHRLSPGSSLLNPEQHLGHRPLTAPRHVDIVAGCFTVIERALWETLGGYDEGFFLCGEDFDLSLRAIEAGASPVVLPVEPIVHHSGSSFRSPGEARAAYLRGRAQFQRRWWSPRSAEAADAFRRTGVLARLLATHLLRSPRREEFTSLWDLRGNWSLPAGG